MDIKKMEIRVFRKSIKLIATDENDIPYEITDVPAINKAIAIFCSEHKKSFEDLLRENKIILDERVSNEDYVLEDGGKFIEKAKVLKEAGF